MMKKWVQTRSIPQRESQFQVICSSEQPIPPSRSIPLAQGLCKHHRQSGLPAGQGVVVERGSDSEFIWFELGGLSLLQLPSNLIFGRSPDFEARQTFAQIPAPPLTS